MSVVRTDSSRKFIIMAYPKALIEHAKALYCTGMVSPEKIAEELKIKVPKTIYLWINKFGWKRTKENIQTNVNTRVSHAQTTQELQIEKTITDKITESTLEMIDRHTKIGKFMMAKGFARIDKAKPEDLSVPQAIFLMDKGTDIERKAQTIGKDEKPAVVLNIMSLWSGISEEDLK